MTKKINHTKIAECIKKLTICDEGKQGITEILKEFGYNPPKGPKLRMPKVGEVWQDNITNEAFVVAYINKDKSEISVHYLKNYDSGDTSVGEWPTDFERDEFVARSLNEYFGVK